MSVVTLRFVPRVPFLSWIVMNSPVLRVEPTTLLMDPTEISDNYGPEVGVYNTKLTRPHFGPRKRKKFMRSNSWDVISLYSDPFRPLNSLTSKMTPISCPTLFLR